MAAVDVTVSGVLYDKVNRTTQQVVLIGEATVTGVGIGGGPIIPPPQQPGGSGGVPTHPIMLPGMPGWGDPHPEHPIELPPKPPEPVTPPIDWKVIWHPEEGWVVVGVPQFPHPSPSQAGAPTPGAQPPKK